MYLQSEENHNNKTICDAEASDNIRGLDNLLAVDI